MILTTRGSSPVRRDVVAFITVSGVFNLSGYLDTVVPAGTGLL